MDAFSTLTATALPLVRDNVDTDIIIPSREMKSVGKTGLTDGLFAGWRYTTIGGREENPEFILNIRRDAQIWLAGENVGCGSSREHAVWALHEYGFRAVVAPSFNPIFRNNCVRNGIVPAQLPRDQVEALAAADRPVTVDLESCTIRAAGVGPFAFTLDQDALAMLRNGWDAIDLTLAGIDAIRAFRTADQKRRPWAYPSHMDTAA